MAECKQTKKYNGVRQTHTIGTVSKATWWTGRCLHRSFKEKMITHSISVARWGAFQFVEVITAFGGGVLLLKVPNKGRRRQEDVVTSTNWKAPHLATDMSEWSSFLWRFYEGGVLSTTSPCLRFLLVIVRCGLLVLEATNLSVMVNELLRTYFKRKSFWKSNIFVTAPYFLVFLTLCSQLKFMKMQKKTPLWTKERLQGAKYPTISES